jgi:N-acetylglucosaminyldiphosphoundecaprenol N-acetyl-beta-D-mannosaminyltransferase
VLVAVATYRRLESVTRLLDCAVDQQWSRRAHIVVLDNDPDRSAAPVRSHPALSETGYVPVPQPGVVAVRNAAVDEAAERDADYLVFVDDDMTPSPQWFDALLDTANTFDADIVQGRIMQPPSVLAKPYARAALGRENPLPTGRFDGDVSSGNLLIRQRFLQESRLRFDPRFNGMGGEDTQFGRRALRRGAVMVYCREAATLEHNSAEDITVGRLLHRSYNNGRSLTTVNRSLGATEPLPLRALRWSVATPWSLARATGSALTRRPEQFWRHLFSVARHSGRLRSGAGSAHGHYRGIGTLGDSMGTRQQADSMVTFAPFRLADASRSDVVDRLVTMACSHTVARAYALHVGGLNARHDTEYTSALAHGELVYADGVAVVLLSRLAGARRIERSPTTDIGWDVLHRHSRQVGRPTRVALVGGPDGLADRAAATLEQQAAVEVVRTCSGYTSDWSQALASVREAEPDVTFLGLGSPLEVVFCENRRDELPAGLVMTCGGWFGFLAAEERRAPGLLQRSGLEWVSRLAQSPRRLAPRYAAGVVSSARLGIAALAARRRRLHGGHTSPRRR